MSDNLTISIGGDDGSALSRQVSSTCKAPKLFKSLT